jgi:phage terminase large subunit
MIDVREKWVKASKWINLDYKDQQDLKSLGIFPINDAFEPLWISDYDILLARGGRGGGKSEHFSQKLITDCRNQEYFKCYYGRKVFDTVRGSCFETLVHNLEELRIHKEFSFSIAQSSSMKIVDKETGNSFHPFGSDKADKLKSIKDPTHMWCEEFDQFTFDDFKELLPTLRTERGRNEFLATFNTHNVFPDHWIIKYFFPELYQGEDKSEFDILSEINVKHLFVNYSDNYFIDQEAYYKKLKLASGGNTMLLNAIANGEWGAIENDAPWLYSFDVNKHIKPNISFMPSFPIYVFIDVNNDPLECSIWQVSPNKGDRNSFIHCIDEFSGKFKVTELGQQIKAKYPNSIIYLGGDRSGQNEDVGRNQTIYQILGGAMGLSDRQLLLNTHNLEHADSRLLCNAMIHNYPNFYISGNCHNLIRQCQIAKVDVKSSTPSKLLKDRGMYKLDEFDSMRYMFQTLFNDWAKNTYFKVIKK